MALPTNASIFKDALGKDVLHDPRDRVDYQAELSTLKLLESGETVTSYTLTARAEAVALGVLIGTTTYAPSQPDATHIKFWLEVDPTFQSNAAYDDPGFYAGVEVEVNTNNTPSRRRQRTCAVKMVQL